MPKRRRLVGTISDVKQIWLLSFMICLYYFSISLKQLLTIWSPTSLHILLAVSLPGLCLKVPINKLPTYVIILFSLVRFVWWNNVQLVLLCSYDGLHMLLPNVVNVIPINVSNIKLALVILLCSQHYQYLLKILLRNVNLALPIPILVIILSITNTNTCHYT